MMILRHSRDQQRHFFSPEQWYETRQSACLCSRRFWGDCRCFESPDCPAGTSADFNRDGFTDFFDYDAFVAAFENGC